MGSSTHLNQEHPRLNTIMYNHCNESMKNRKFLDNRALFNAFLKVINFSCSRLNVVHSPIWSSDNSDLLNLLILFLLRNRQTIAIILITRYLYINAKQSILRLHPPCSYSLMPWDASSLTPIPFPPQTTSTWDPEGHSLHRCRGWTKYPSRHTRR